ncbi:hemerythrin domain-containing protein [Propylenella binzhouense]|uniref:Hemerythrin domain-containing protein n=1 Tax=Propylenella binzhouense TaxID=2555902 RepID=A0A964T6V4_9HYPH|nr:hemerythrin domain-containing protein [Propylenella binzhouense]MYZ48992.1 hemerythrin domain-containing protein [Propylenella binzhouense]
MSDPSGLFARAGLPEDLTFLLAKYPRLHWPEHRNLGALARFWMGRHDMFRELSAALGAASEHHLAGAIDGASFRAWFAPRFGFFLGELEGHHQIEDHHYFPVLCTAERRLARGFDLLETDHDTIHRRLAELDAAWRAFDAALRRGEDARPAGETLSGMLTGFLAPLGRHLADEEDLIVPVLLDRGESALGFA